MTGINLRCPKCGALPGEPCRSVRTGERMWSYPYDTHKKRRMVEILGAPSTEQLAVPVRVSALKRAWVGAVDSRLKTL